MKKVLLARGRKVDHMIKSESDVLLSKKKKSVELQLFSYPSV